MVTSGRQPDSPGASAPSLLMLADGDDVLIAAGDLQPGAHRSSTGEEVVVIDAVPLGHKVAARSIAAGDRVLRCGVPIGSATADIEPGAWVHTHNLQSDYLATFARRGGEH